jgi:methionyl-tRNA synthetase
MSRTFYVTTPIYYVNAKPHHGHAYTTIIADILKRYYKLRGYEVFFLTGTDEHGDKVAEAAEADGINPKLYADMISRSFSELWPQLNISNDRFIRTTDEAHIQVVKRILQDVYDKGDIYFDEYAGLYCFGCERFLTEKELVDGKCPDHKKEPELIKEENYFFRMSKYQDWLIKYIEDHPDFIAPERYRNEVMAMLRDPLEDLCISRPKQRLQWGISLPFDDKFVTYVWFDALINYISALGYPDGELFKKFWPSVHHIIAKDILKPHAIFWPTMLKSIGIEPYRKLRVHGYWNVDGAKMSKSLGNVIKPLELKDKYGLDPFRYFMAREMVFGLDASFSEEALVHRINFDLANDLGNLVHRSLTMSRKYFKGELGSKGNPEELEREFAASVVDCVKDIPNLIEKVELKRVLENIWKIINATNKYIDSSEPWSLAKDEAKRERLEAVIYHVMEALRIISVLISPVMPDTGARIGEFLDLTDADGRDFDSAMSFGKLTVPRKVKKGLPLFPRVEWKGVAGDTAEAEKVEKKEQKEQKPHIDIEDVYKVELRSAKVTAAEPIAGTDKLLKLSVDLDGKRTLVAGIAEHYRPEDLIGKTVIVVANLKPVKIRGIESRGMLLAVEDKDGYSILTTDRTVEVGSLVR